MASTLRATVPTTVEKIPPDLPMSIGIRRQELKAEDGQAAAQDIDDDENEDARP